MVVGDGAGGSLRGPMKHSKSAFLQDYKDHKDSILDPKKKSEEKFRLTGKTSVLSICLN